MDPLKELKHVLEKEIEEISKKNDISPTELDRLDKAVDIIKDIETICSMKEYSYDDDGYSERYPYYMRDNRRSYRMVDYSGGGGTPPYMWDEPGASYRRGRDSMGRYASRDPYAYDTRSYGYSGHNREDLKMDLRDMMNNTKNDKERMAIQQLLDQWKE